MNCAPTMKSRRAGWAIAKRRDHAVRLRLPPFLGRRGFGYVAKPTRPSLGVGFRNNDPLRWGGVWILRLRAE